MERYAIRGIPQHYRAIDTDFGTGLKVARRGDQLARLDGRVCRQRPGIHICAPEPISFSLISTAHRDRHVYGSLGAIDS